MKWVLISILFLSVRSQEDGFGNFLTNALLDYPGWLRSNGLDPSPAISYSVNLNYSSSLMNLFGDIRNHVMVNYSSAFERSDMVESSNLLQGSFMIRFDFGRLMTAISEYNIDGNILSTIPVYGNGLSHAEIDIGGPGLMYWVENFGVTPDGFIDLSVAQIHGSNVAWTDTLLFDLLTAGGYEADVVKVLKEKFDNEINYWMPEALADMMTRYFTEVFAKTPISEIIGTTLRPPTTTTELSSDTPTTEISEKPTTSTQNPCAFDGEIISEKLIDSRETSIGERKGVLITKIITIFKEN